MNTYLFQSQVAVRFPSCLLNSPYPAALFCSKHLQRAELVLPCLRLQLALSLGPAEQQSCNFGTVFLLTHTDCSRAALFP